MPTPSYESGRQTATNQNREERGKKRGANAALGKISKLSEKEIQGVLRERKIMRGKGDEI